MLTLLFSLFGIIVGIALAFLNWKSIVSVGAIATNAIGPVLSLSEDKVEAINYLMNSSVLVRPIVLGMTLASITFLIVLVGGAVSVSARHYYQGKRESDPEAMYKAVHRGLMLFSLGIHGYLTSEPEVLARNQIAQLETRKNMVELMFTTVVKEMAERPDCGHQHFKDAVNAAGRSLLQHVFGDGPSLQQFRMAFFLLSDDKSRLEYCVPINNGTWTAHNTGLSLTIKSFAGSALTHDRPLVYPRDKKKAGYEARTGSQPYKSWIVIPVPCGLGCSKHIGAVTVDYTGKDDVFTTERTEILFSFTQLVYLLYQSNYGGTGHDKHNTI